MLKMVRKRAVHKYHGSYPAWWWGEKVNEYVDIVRAGFTDVYVFIPDQRILMIADLVKNCVFSD